MKSLKARVIGLCEYLGIYEEVSSFLDYLRNEKKQLRTRKPEPDALHLSTKEQLEWLWSNCKIEYEHPIEVETIIHDPTKDKQGRDFIEL